MHAQQLTRHSAFPRTTAGASVPPERREAERIGILRRYDPNDGDRRSQQCRGEHLGYRILQHSGRFFAVPSVLGPICLADRRQRSNAWIFSAATLEQLRDDLDRRADEGILPLYLETLAGHAILACSENF